MKIKDFFKIMVRWSSGKRFDPHYQDRTDAMEDIAIGQAKRGKGARIGNNGFKAHPSPK